MCIYASNMVCCILLAGLPFCMKTLCWNAHTPPKSNVSFLWDTFNSLIQKYTQLQMLLTCHRHVLMSARCCKILKLTCSQWHRVIFYSESHVCGVLWSQIVSEHGLAHKKNSFKEYIFLTFKQYHISRVFICKVNIVQKKYIQLFF